MCPSTGHFQDAYGARRREVRTNHSAASMALPLPWFAAMSRFRLRILTALVVAAPILSQTDNRPRFEVASVKPSPPSDRQIRSDIIAMSGGGLRVINKTLREIIGWAYFMDCDDCGDRVRGGPDWMDALRYDIEARPSQPMENLDHLTAAQRRRQ